MNLFSRIFSANNLSDRSIASAAMRKGSTPESRKSLSSCLALDDGIAAFSYRVNPIIHIDINKQYVLLRQGACALRYIWQITDGIHIKTTHLAHTMDKISTQIDAELVEECKQQKDKWKTTTCFIHDMIKLGLKVEKRGLDAYGTLGLPNDLERDKEKKKAEVVPNSNKVPNRINKEKSKKEKDPFLRSVLTSKDIPKDLSDCMDLFIEWWEVRHKSKKATCSLKVAAREFNKLREWPLVVRKDALERAIAGGWTQLYKPHEKMKEEPNPRGGQYRVFKNGEFVDE